MISVIVPVYNVEEYLNDCIESILRQTCDDFELILVDDGSTDSSGLICDSYSENKKIKIIHQRNQGLSAARNTGLQHAEGDYICFIDSDDWVENIYLEQFIQLINNYGADIAVCEFNIVSDNEKAKVNVNAKISITDKEDSIRLLIQHQEKCSACAKMFRKHILDNFEFPVGRLYEDLFVMHHIFLQTNKIVWNSAKNYHYRMRNNSIIHQSFNLRLLDKVSALKKRYDDLSELTWLPETLKEGAYLKYMEGIALACCDMNVSGYKKTDIYFEYISRVKTITLSQIVKGRLSKSGFLSCLLIKYNEKLFGLYINLRYGSRG